MPRSWDIFCKVVDNFGDAAVCWRLARQLAGEHRGRVRLWIDELPALHALCSSAQPKGPRQRVESVEICEWTPAADFGEPAEIVVEAFGCGLPDAYVASMAHQARPPLWVILEYLSAEPWVATHHKLPSPHPRLPLDRSFFFPGFAPGTAGVLREAPYENRRRSFEGAPSSKADFWTPLGFGEPGQDASIVSMFGYENDSAPNLLRAWSEGPTEMVAVVPRSRLRPQVAEFFGRTDPADGETLSQGNLEVRFLPFLPQHTYDELLWASDWNFVRGEDSFVRAQWARRPFVWHIYPQEQRAHEPKLEAFLDLYCEGLAQDLATALRTVWRNWNGIDPGASGSPTLREAWGILQSGRAPLLAYAGNWAGRLESMGDLAGNLALYCEERLK